MTRFELPQTFYLTGKQIPIRKIRGWSRLLDLSGYIVMVLFANLLLDHRKRGSAASKLHSHGPQVLYYKLVEF